MKEESNVRVHRTFECFIKGRTLIIKLGKREKVSEVRDFVSRRGSDLPTEISEE